MCKDCGCQEGNKRAYFGVMSPNQSHHHGPTKKISLETSVLAKNDQFAESNRVWFKKHNTKTINMMSSPGSGKTLLLEKTLAAFPTTKKITIITGDQEESFDADRLQGKGAIVKQLNTYSSCHLDAQMISHELGKSISEDTDLLIIENVGNLVCPAAFDLGEDKKIALLSTTEGEDKPSKYPVLFHTASAIIITKTDLIPHLDWSLEKCISHIRRVNPTAPIIKLSAKSGEGMNDWINYLNSI
jgi:hydrogenase nickel incorporation protein HypB